MTYNLNFKPKALKEWTKLDTAIKEQFKKKLKNILQNSKIGKQDKFYENLEKSS